MGKTKKVDRILGKLDDKNNELITDEYFGCAPRIYEQISCCLSLSRMNAYEGDRQGCIKELRDLISIINYSIDGRTTNDAYMVKVLREMEQQTNDAILEIGKIWEYSVKSVILTLIKKIWKRIKRFF